MLVFFPFILLLSLVFCCSVVGNQKKGKKSILTPSPFLLLLFVWFYLNSLSSSPLNAAPWRASSFAISWTVSWIASSPSDLARAAISSLAAQAPVSASTLA